MDRVITEMIATDNQPFTVVSDVGFKRVMATAEPRYKIKDEKFYRTDMLNSIHSQIQDKVKSLLENICPSPPTAGQEQMSP